MEKIILITVLVLFAGAFVAMLFGPIFYFMGNDDFTAELNDGRRATLLRLVRNNDNTISIERKEFLGRWNRQTCKITENSSRLNRRTYHDKLEETEENIQYMNEEMARKQETVRQNAGKRIAHEKAVALQKSKPKIISKNP